MRLILLRLKEFFTCLLHYKVLWQMYLDRKNGIKIIVYQIGSAGQLQYFMPIHKQLCNKKDKLSFYLCMSYPMPEVAHELEISKSKTMPSSIAKFLFLADMFVCTEIDAKSYKHAIKIFSGHGHANKLSYWAKGNLKSMDIYFLCSPLERAMFQVIQESNPEDTKHIELVNVGYPKTDDLVNANYDRNEIMNRLGLNPAFKTVIYSPAWDPGGSLRTFGTHVIETLLNIPDINVLVKLHPASLEKKESPYFEFYTGGKVWQEEFAKFSHNPRFRFINEYVINPYLCISDMMVNDFSGVALEYMALNRPIIYIDCPEYYEKVLLEWKCDPVMAKQDERFNAGRHVGSVVHSMEQLATQVLKELQDPKLNEDKRKQFAQKVMYNPGKGAVMACADIMNRLKIS